MDNLKLIKDRINQDIDPAGAPGSILAINHNEIEQSILSSVGKYVGSSYVAVKTATVFTSGVFSWEGNAMNNVADFTIKVSKKTSDLNDFGLLLNTLVETDIIQFKDFSGRSVYLVFKSYTAGTDGSGNDIYNIVVAGLAENPNYIYQTNENNICVLSLNKQIVPVTGFVPSGGYTGSGQDLKDEIDTKLNIADYNEYFKGKYISLVALQTAKPTGNDGDYAIVDPGTGVDALEYIWDTDEGWVLAGASGASTTDALPEGSTNLYFTVARVLATILTGISFATGGAIVSTDTILIAFGKLQKQITDLLATVTRIDVAEFPFACSDEVTDLTQGLLISFRMPVGLTLTSVKLSLNVAPTLSKVIVDVKKNGTSIFSTLISVDTSSTTSVGASVPYVLSTTNLADDDVITVFTTQVGSGVAGKGLKVSLIGKRV